MKTKFFQVLFFSLLVVSGLSLKAQPRFAKSNNGQSRILSVIPDLTQEQKTKILGYQNDMQKKNLELKSQLQVKQAELRKLMASDAKTSEKEAIVKEIESIKTQMYLNRIEYHDKVRSLLNDDQKLAYDNWILKPHHHHRGKPHGMYRRRGR